MIQEGTPSSASSSQVDCLACGERGRYWITKAARDVWRCRRCALVWVPEGLVVDDAGASIYETETPIFLQDGNEAYYLDETNLASCREKVAFVASHLPAGKRLLDAGANFGHFLSVARDRYEARGVEISKAAVAWSIDHFGVENHAASIYALPKELAGPYDAVTLWDVIEHVPRPAEALEALRRTLAPGGLLFLSTPDAGSKVARAMGARWHYLDPIQHIVLFDRKNLGRLVAGAGFELLAVRTFGHHYRVGYVLDRLAYLHAGGVLGAVTTTARKLGSPLSRRSLYLNLGDVMGLVARRVG
ncbi:MAG: class I SAM-dependent methyltransferase [Labilithrix sp.]|nr:class I SAM-dependent methyltransferase [Labilithrix sp.]